MNKKEYKKIGALNEGSLIDCFGKTLRVCRHIDGFTYAIHKVRGLYRIPSSRIVIVIKSYNHEKRSLQTN